MGAIPPVRSKAVAASGETIEDEMQAGLKEG